MLIQQRSVNAARQGVNAIPDDRRIAAVSVFASSRDYGLELSVYFSDGAVELVNCRVQGKTDS